MTQWAARPAFVDQDDRPAPACTGHDPDLWFPATEYGPAAREAKAICAICPHEDACREWAYAQPVTQLYGIWGGTTKPDRERHKRLTSKQ